MKGSARVDIVRVMILSRLTRAPLGLGVAVCLAACLAGASAQEGPREDGRPRILVPAPGVGEYLRVPPSADRSPDAPSPGLYRRVPREERSDRPVSKALPDDDGLDAPRDGGCLSARDARDAIRSKRAVPLAAAARAARAAWDGEVIDYKLCRVSGLLTYNLTLLSDDGRVARARVDAGTGKLLAVK